MKALLIWRKSKNLSAFEAGKRIGVTGVHWGRLENGTRKIAANRVLRVSELTGIPPHRLRSDIFPEPQKEAS